MDRDLIISTIYKYLPKEQQEWELLGFVNSKFEVFPFGTDSKILGRLFEVIIADSLTKAARELGYTLRESEQQTVYPDFWFVKPNGRYIAIDVKTTYRKFTKKGKISKFNFTLGSFTSFMRNGTKNIYGQYNDYDAHYVIGILYSREANPTIKKTKIDQIGTIIPSYEDPEIFVQEKYKISGTQKGSGNTDNIGTIKANTLRPFIEGAGPFSFLGRDVFEHFWVNHPKYTDKEKWYTTLPEYFDWLDQHNKKSSRLRELYAKWKLHISEKGWDIN